MSRFKFAIEIVGGALGLLLFGGIMYVWFLVLIPFLTV